MAVNLWRHQCPVTGQEEVNYEGADCPHCGEKCPEPQPNPAPSDTAPNAG